MQHCCPSCTQKPMTLEGGSLREPVRAMPRSIVPEFCCSSISAEPDFATRSLAYLEQQATSR